MPTPCRACGKEIDEANAPGACPACGTAAPAPNGIRTGSAPVVLIPEVADAPAPPPGTADSAGRNVAATLILICALVVGVATYVISHRVSATFSRWLSGAKIPEADWQEFAIPEAGFSASLPGRPSLLSAPPGPLPPNAHVRKWGLERKEDGIVFAVVHFAFRGVHLPNLDEVHRSERENMLAVSKGTLISEGGVRLGGIDGKEYRIAVPDGGRIVCVQCGRPCDGGVDVLLVMAAGEKRRVEGADGARFFGSVRIEAEVPPPKHEPPRTDGVKPPDRPKSERPPGERPVWEETAANRALGLAFSPDGTALAVGHVDARFRLWDVARGVEKMTRPERIAVWCVAWRPDGKRVAYGANHGTAVVWDIEAGREAARHRVLHETAGEKSSVQALAWSPDGRTLAVGIQPQGSTHGEVHLLDAESGVARAVMRRCGESPSRLEIAKGGALVAIFGSKARVCDPGTLAVRREHTGGPGARLAGATVSPDGKTLACLCADKSVRLVDLESGGERAAWKVSTVGNIGYHHPVAFSPDGAILLVGIQGGALHSFETRTGKERIRAVGGAPGPFTRFAFSPDGGLLATHNYNGTKILEVARQADLFGP